MFIHTILEGTYLLTTVSLPPSHGGESSSTLMFSASSCTIRAVVMGASLSSDSREGPAAEALASVRLAPAAPCSKHLRNCFTLSSLCCYSFSFPFPQFFRTAFVFFLLSFSIFVFRMLVCCFFFFSCSLHHHRLFIIKSDWTSGCVEHTWVGLLGLCSLS